MSEDTAKQQKLKLGKVLGKGSFAVVHAGHQDGVGDVAVKVLHDTLRPSVKQKALAAKAQQGHQQLIVSCDLPDLGSGDNTDGDMAFKLFYREAWIMTKLQHRSLVKCYGVHQLPHNFPGLERPMDETAGGPAQGGAAAGSRWCMVLERCTGGSLTRVLVNQMKSGGSRCYTTLDVLSWLHDVAEGVAHLHVQQPPVIHRDLKCENVLLKVPHKKNAGVPVLVTDLGLHVRVGNKHQRALRRVSAAGSPATTTHREQIRTSLSTSALKTGKKTDLAMGPLSMARAPTSAMAGGDIGDIGRLSAADNELDGSLIDMNTMKTLDADQMEPAIFMLPSQAAEQGLEVPEDMAVPSDPAAAFVALCCSDEDPARSDGLYDAPKVLRKRSPQSTPQIVDADRSHRSNKSGGSFSDKDKSARSVRSDVDDSFLGSGMFNLPLHQGTSTEPPGATPLRSPSPGLPSFLVRSPSPGLPPRSPSPALPQPLPRSTSSVSRAASSGFPTLPSGPLSNPMPMPDPIPDLCALAEDVSVHGSRFYSSQGYSPNLAPQSDEASGTSVSVVAPVLFGARTATSYNGSASGCDSYLVLPTAQLRQNPGPVSGGPPSHTPSRFSMPLPAHASDTVTQSPRSGGSLLRPAQAITPSAPPDGPSQGGHSSATPFRPPAITAPRSATFDTVLSPTECKPSFKPAGAITPVTGRIPILLTTSSNFQSGPLRGPRSSSKGHIGQQDESSSGALIYNPDTGHVSVRRDSTSKQRSRSSHHLSLNPRTMSGAVSASDFGGVLSVSPASPAVANKTWSMAGDEFIRQSARSSHHGGNDKSAPVSGHFATAKSMAASEPDQPFLYVEVQGQAGQVVGLPLPGLARSVMAGLTAEELAWVYSLTGATGSAFYMAPEVYKAEPYNEKIDVFSFGVIAYELLSRSLLMFSHLGTAHLPGVHTPDDYCAKVATGYRPSKPSCVSGSVEDQLWELIGRCWSQDPNMRPSMQDVALLLEVMAEEEAINSPPSDGTPGGCRTSCCTVM